MPTDLDFDRLRTPDAHGHVLIEPAADALPALAAHNRAHLDRHDFRILDVSAREAREALRAAADLPAGPLIVTGHQPDFIHAGVWAKHVVAVRLAAAVDGTPLNLVVDHDAPKQTALLVPAVRGDQVTPRWISYAQWPRGAAFEGMPAADAGECRRLAEEARAALGPHDEPSMLGRFFAGYCGAGNVADWVDQQVAGRRAVEQELGVSLLDRRVSAIWCGPLLGALLAEPQRFAVAYNAALAEYRRRHRVRGADRPIPDLHVDAERCEIAAWVYRPGDVRRRLFVGRRKAALVLYAGAEAAAELDPSSVTTWHGLCAALKSVAPWVIRPRALTLTLWARLLLADLFIHGIGGAKYDRVTDAIIRGFFKLEPPKMACVSATLRLGLPRHDVTAGARARARRRLRELAFNPQRFVSGPEDEADLAARAAAIAESVRLRRDDPGDRAARRRVFAGIRAANAAIGARHPDLRGSFLAHDARIARQLEENRAADHREYFFAMHARRDLEMLLEKLPSVQALAGSAIV